MTKLPKPSTRKCKACESSKVGLGIEHSFYPPSALVCHDCGFIDQEDEDQIISSPPARRKLTCPHCSTSWNTAIEGDVEWCINCGFSPSQDVYPTPELALLWNKGSVIRGRMEADTKWMKPNTPVGMFLRTHCGPHCPYSEDCDQTLQDLLDCFREGDSTMGRRANKKKRKKSLAQNKQSIQASIPAKKEVSAKIVCSNRGWFARYLNETINKEQAISVGSGSGTEELSTGDTDRREPSVD
jgi:hypothetical protein